MSIQKTDIKATGEDAGSSSRISNTQTQLVDIVDTLDDYILPTQTDQRALLQEELDEAEKSLRAIYTRVTNLRKQLHLPPLSLGPESDPPAYNSLLTSAPVPNLPEVSVPFHTNLEWFDMVARGSGSWSTLTLGLSRKVDEWDIIDFIIFNGKKISKPNGGWGEYSGPRMMYGTKNATSIVIVLGEEWRTAQDADQSKELTAKSQREIQYSMTVDRSEWGMATIPRSFAIQRIHEQ